MARLRLPHGGGQPNRSVIQGARMVDVPRKLKQDAILEAVAEVQFEHESVSEVVVGKLASAPAWEGYSSARLPLGELPSVFRDQDEQLRFKPYLQLQRPAGGEVVQIGPRVVSIHNLAPYDGWDRFFGRIQQLVGALRDAVGKPFIHRAGLRYVNALAPAHGFSSLWDLNFNFEIAGDRPAAEFTTTYRSYVEQNLRCQLTLAAPAFVTVGNLPPDAVAFVDVDVSSRLPLGEVTDDVLIKWFGKAHEVEKDAFFTLWPEENLNAMKES